MSRRRSATWAPLVIVVGALGLGLIFVLGSATPVDAQVTCAPGTEIYQVSTAADINAAIRCHNESTIEPPPPAVTVLLQNDIAADTVAGNSVFEPLERGRLAIVGLPTEDDLDAANFDPSQGFQIRRGAAADTTPLPLFSGASDARIWLIAVELEMGPHDTFGVHAGEVILDNSAITSSSAHPDAAAISADQGMFINRSLVRGIPTGAQGRAEAFSESMFVSYSTIISTETDLQFIGGGFGIVRNSTLAGPIGVQIGQGDISVEGVTVVGDALLAPVGASGVMSMRGSIANTCTATEIQDFQAGPGWFDNGDNAGACFADGAIATIAALADNGCRLPTPVGCPPTAAIDSTSTAYQAAQVCRQLDDQRGVPRQQPGPCDAGAYEASCEIDGPVNAAVSTFGEFSSAVRCHNRGGNGPSNITLFNSITAPFSFPTIRGSSELFIDGNGHTLARSGTTPGPVLQARNTNLRVQDLAIVVSANDASGIEHLGNGRLSVTRSSIHATTLDSTATGIVTGPALDEFTMEHSSIRGTQTGLLVESPVNLITGSTIEATNTAAVWLALTRGGGFVNSTLAAPVVIEVGGPGLIVDNSTLIGTAVTPAATAGTETALVFRSSIFNTCLLPDISNGQQGPGWINVGGSVGECVDPSTPVLLTLDEVSDCVDPTPSGCPRMAAIGVSSPAYQAGICLPGRFGPNEFDQRGAPRTPVGPGCDAGAFEAGASALGDVNGDGVVDNAEVQALLEWLAGGDEPVALIVGELTADGTVNLDDALALAQLTG